PAPSFAPGLIGSTAENNCAAFLQSFGYKVDLVGRPAGAGGQPDDEAVVILMPVASPSFNPAARSVSDDETMKQVLAGFRAAHQYLPSVRTLTVGLEWGDYVIMFPLEAASWQAFLDQTR